MLPDNLLKITKPCVDAKYFINRKFKQTSPGVFLREDSKQIPGTNQIIKRMIEFRVFDVDPYIGTNIEVRYDGRMAPYPGIGSGYWVNLRDFESTFKI